MLLVSAGFSCLIVEPTFAYVSCGGYFLTRKRSKPMHHHMCCFTRSRSLSLKFPSNYSSISHGQVGKFTPKCSSTLWFSYIGELRGFSITKCNFANFRPSTVSLMLKSLCLGMRPRHNRKATLPLLHYVINELLLREVQGTR